MKFNHVALGGVSVLMFGAGILGTTVAHAETPTVKPGASCSPVGATGVSSVTPGQPMQCQSYPDGRMTWGEVGAPPVTPKPTATATPKPTPAATPRATITDPIRTPKPIVTPAGKVIASYSCNAVTFANDTNKTVTVFAGTAQTDDVEATITIAPGLGKTMRSTNTNFGWTAKIQGTETVVGQRLSPGENLQAKCGTAGVTPSSTPSRTVGVDTTRGLASTGA